MPRFRVIQSERYRAVYMVDAASAEEAQEAIEEGEHEDGSAITFDLVGADVIEVEEVDEA